jgi:hypothetical protein
MGLEKNNINQIQYIFIKYNNPVISGFFLKNGIIIEFDSLLSNPIQRNLIIRSKLSSKSWCGYFESNISKIIQYKK